MVQRIEDDLAAKAILDEAVASYYGIASAMSVSILLVVFGVMGAMRWFEVRGPAWVRLGTV